MADDGWVRIPPPTYRQRLVIGTIWIFVASYVGWRPCAWLGARLEERIDGVVRLLEDPQHARTLPR